jgi:hypothetical protein
MYFVVMRSVFASAPDRGIGEPLMDDRYDLKGSWVGRSSPGAALKPNGSGFLKKVSE